MKRQRFTAGVKPLSEDLNGLNENVESALSDFFNIFGGSSGTVLFNRNNPIVVNVGGTNTDLQVTTPSNTMAVTGAVEASTTYTETLPITAADLLVEVYFIVRRLDVQATRNFLSVDASTGSSIVQDLETSVCDITEIEVIYLSSSNIADVLDPPVLGPDELGFIHLGSLVYLDSDNSVTFTEDLTSDFTLPSGVSVLATPHADQHLSTGTDPIQLAVTTAAPEGSLEGLMPEGALAASLGGIQDLVAETGSTFLSFATTGDNLVTAGTFDPKQAIATLNLSPSLTAEVTNSVPTLGVKYLAQGQVNGTSDFAARSDHEHTLLQSGFIIQQKTIEVTADDRGTR